MKLRSIGESEDGSSPLEKLTNERVESRKNNYADSDDTENEELGAKQITMEYYDNSEVSSTT